jgi:peptidyl-prolyl cis-trans isomerase C
MLGLVMVAGGCGRRPPPEPLVAEVDGRPVPQARFDQYVAMKSGATRAQIDPGLKARLLEDLLRLEAAAALGSRQSGTAVREQAEIARLESLAQSAARAAGVFDEPSDAELRAAYASYIAALPTREYHAAHILTATENAAALVVTQLQAGMDFEAVAGAVSLDDSKTRGGDLGWIRPGHLPPQLFTALDALEAGEFSATPIKTPYGWHVVRLIEVRAAETPQFESVKAQLVVNLQQERYRQFLEQALAQVEVERP